MHDSVVDIEYRNIPSSSPSVFELVRQGKIVVLRGCPEVATVREIYDSWEECYTGRRGEIFDLLDRKKCPSVRGAHALSRGVRALRESFTMPALLSDLLVACRFPEPSVLDIGLTRLVLPTWYSDFLQQRSDVFSPEDFHSPTLGALREVFYVRKDYGQPHRELDQPHAIFQTHLWFPLHDVRAEESLPLFPEPYRTDMTIDRGQKDKPLAQWGLGDPLLIPLRVGDVIVFHSEHVHSSPKRHENTVRMSYDFRVASYCQTDHGWHHQDFWNLRNFLPTTLIEPGKAGNSGVRALNMLNAYFGQISSPTAHLAENLPDVSAQQYLYWTRKHQHEVSTRFLNEVAEVFDAFPFCEDRYIGLARLCWQRDTELALKLCEIVRRQSESYFWLWRAGEIALSLGASDLARTILDQSLACAQTTPYDTSHNPTPYLNGRHQTSPEFSPERVIKMILESQAALANIDAWSATIPSHFGRALHHAPGGRELS